MRLLADIGGTNVRFALLEDGSREPQRELDLRCSDFSGLADAVWHYLGTVGRPSVREAAIDVATAVSGDFVKLTNSPWAFSIEQIQAALGLERLVVLNDFTALALSLPQLRPEDLTPIGGGVPRPRAAIGLIGPGTGLGVSGLIACGDHYVPLQGEGGHTAFSPMDEREDAVLGVLRVRYGHVSMERLVSGPGLVTLYEALCSVDRALHRPLSPEQITRAALGGEDARCCEALDLFCAMLGTAAANLAVTLGAFGGIYIGGGIVPKLGTYFAASPFRQRFEHKGRFSGYTAGIPVWVIHATNPALRGLAAALEGAPH